MKPKHKAGDECVFDYPKAFVMLPEYSAHRGQVVVVLGLLPEDKYDYLGDPMYYIRADDGWEGEAWESELIKEQK